MAQDDPKEPLSDPATQLRLAALLAEAGRSDEARELYFQVAQDLAREGFAAKALAVIRRGLKAGPADGLTLWRAAELAGWSQDAARWWDQAAELLRGEGDAARSREAANKAEAIHRIYVKKE